jgi:ABC-type uncharacterized transport system involved in gliding motility auxiliary subunit
LVLLGLIILNVISGSIFTRFDLTQDKRYTLSEASKSTLATVNSPMIITVFLKGDLPSEYKRLADETEQLLEEFATHNGNIVYNFVDPIAENDIDYLTQNQMQPRYIRGQSQSITIRL